MSGAVVEKFTALRKNSLRGFVTMRLASGMVVHDITVHVGTDNKAWASPPSKPMLDREQQVLRDTEGKIRYVPLISFATKQQRDQFSSLVVDAVRTTNPEALS